MTTAPIVVSPANSQEDSSIFWFSKWQGGAPLTPADWIALAEEKVRSIHPQKDGFGVLVSLTTYCIVFSLSLLVDATALG